MAKITRFGVSLENELLEEFDREIEKEGYPTRSKAISDLINNFLLHRIKVKGEYVAGVISLIYDHERRLISETLTDIQHKYHHLIISSQHIHMSQERCFEIVIVKGKDSEIEELFNSLKGVKGVLNAYLTIAGSCNFD